MDIGQQRHKWLTQRSRKWLAYGLPRRCPPCLLKSLLLGEKAGILIAFTMFAYSDFTGHPSPQKLKWQWYCSMPRKTYRLLMILPSTTMFVSFCTAVCYLLPVVCGVFKQFVYLPRKQKAHYHDTSRLGLTTYTEDDMNEFVSWTKVWMINQGVDGWNLGKPPWIFLNKTMSISWVTYLPPSGAFRPLMILQMLLVPFFTHPTTLSAGKVAMSADPYNTNQHNAIA